MSQSAVAPRAATAPLINLDKIEAVCVGLVLLNQVLGLFAPPEAFLLSPETYSGVSTQTGAAPLAFPITSMVSHAVEALVGLLLCRHWRSYLGLIGRGAPIFMQVAVFWLSTLWSVSQTESLRASLHLLIFYIFALELVRSYSVIGLTRLLVRLFAILALSSFLMLLVFPGLSHEFGNEGFGNDWRGAVSNKNSLGATCSIGVIVCGYSLLIGANNRRFALLVLVANLILVAGSRSATSLIASTLCLALLFVLYATRRPGGKLFVVLCSLGALCLLAAALSSVEHPAALLGKSATLTGRTGVWQAVIPIIKSRFVTGYGIGFWVVDTDFRNDIWLYSGWQPPHAHNDVLDVMLQTGVIGAFFFVFNYVASLCLGLRHLWRFEDGYIFCLLICLNFIIRGIAETVSLPPGDVGVTLLFAAEIYLWKLSFAGKISPSAEARALVAAKAPIYRAKPIVH